MPSLLRHMEIAPYYWFDGTIAERETVGVDPFSHGLHYGSGVFEGIRAYGTTRGPAVFRLREHMERFERSAAVYGLELGLDVPALCDAVCETLLRNGLDSAYIRPLAYFGAETASLAPVNVCRTHVLLAYRAFENYFGAGQANGIRATISPWQKFSSKALPATVKACGHYANSVLAMSDAVKRGFSEAIMLNDRGEIAEGTGENVFVVKDGALHTNDTSADILDGITRASVIELARDRGLTVRIAPLRIDDLLTADEAFFTGTAVEVTSLTCVDDYMYSETRPVTAMLREAFDAAVKGDDPKHPDWVWYAR